MKYRPIRVALLALSMVVMFACATTPPTTTAVQPDPNALPTSALFAPLGSKRLIFLHFDQSQSLKKGDVIKPGQLIGSTTPWPKVLSATNDAAIQNAIAAYDIKDYQTALNILRPLYAAEMDNPFYLISTAKTLYWIQGGSDLCLSLLERLKSQVETPYANETDAIVLDLWFPDLYWKMATLYLDKGNYEGAAYEIARSFALGLNPPDSLLEQMLSYLTEAYYQLGETELNSILYEYTLRRFPGNSYVQKFHLP